MKAKIWGSCGSLPSPASPADIREKVRHALRIANGRSFRDEADLDAFLDSLPLSRRGTYKANTSCVEIRAGTHEVLLCDAGTGLRDYAASLGDDPPPATYHIFISHLHWDHIQGFPFFAPAYRPDNHIIFHGFHPQMEASIRGQMDGPSFPVGFEAMRARIDFDLRDEGATFAIGPVHISTIKQKHPGDSWGYRFARGDKAIVYSSDSEHGPEAENPDYPFITFFRDADILIFDGQYTFDEAANAKRYWGHSDHLTAVDLAARARVRRLVMFHHEPGYSDEAIERLHAEALDHRLECNRRLRGTGTGAPVYPAEIHLAYDGLCLEA